MCPTPIIVMEKNRCDMLCLLLLFCSSAVFLQRLVRVFFGCLAAVACGMLYAVYLSTYHDRKYWFSTRQVGYCSFLFIYLFVCSFLNECASITFPLLHHITSVLKFTSMCLRSWNVKSPSKQAAGSIITTISTCWRHHPLKEVYESFLLLIK